jgi:thrombospondin type 3 repeat protein
MNFIRFFFVNSILESKLILIAFFLLLSSLLFAQQDIKVQRGVSTIQAGINDVLLNAPADFSAVSNITKAFVRITNSQHTGAGRDFGNGGTQNSDDVTATIRFDAVNQITIHRIGTANNTRVCWEIVEYIGPGGGDNEFIVRDQNIHTFATTGTNETLNFAGAVATSDLVGFVTGVANPNTGRTEYYTGLVTLEFDDASTLRLRRGDASGNAVQVSYAVVDFIGASWTIQRVEHAYTNAGIPESVSLVTPINTANAFVHTQKRNLAGQNGLDEFGHQVWFPNGNQADFQLCSTATVPASNTSVAWVISNPRMTVSHTNGTRVKNAAPNVEPDFFNVNIPAVSNLLHTSLFVNNDCTGGGTAFPRPIIAARLTAVDTVEMFRSDDGQTQAYRIDVVEWPFTPAFTIEGTIPIATGKKVSLSVNGAAVTTVTTQAGGTFIFELLTSPDANDVLLVYLDGETEKASLVTKTDGTTDLTGANALQLVVYKIILEHQTGTSITNTDLDVIDTVDPGDGGITITGGNATFATDRELWITTDKNYIPGGDVTLTDLEIFGTLTGGSYTFTVNGSWNSNSGTFTAETSTVDFATATAANIAGNTTFNNLRCLVASKSITFEQGSTQTVAGLFRVDGNDFATRISLASSGGAGTTWNLVLNGYHDCRYISVQGSNASGTAFLPIDPVGFLDNGTNTNWYGATTPRELLFNDNFEGSTLASSPPDKESSHWTITGAGSWFTQNTEVVNTQNHTSGGSQSMYSSGGASGQGIGDWNNPDWGSVTNGTAEAWFYDDMGSGKHQWVSVDNNTGYNWLAILIKTTISSNKYIYRGSMTSGYHITFIDRTPGWHKVQWVRDANNTTLYLDDVKLYIASNAQFSDFSDFDCGTMSWDNPGSTAMWFDDFRVYRSQHQSRYRWYNNDDAENPTPLAAENVTISRDQSTITRLRLQLQNDESQAWSGKHIALQYRQGSNGTWTDLGAGVDWNYANGLGTDGSQVANALLANTNVRESFIESIPSASSISLAPGEYGEWDFSIVPTSNSTIGETYYFRAVETTAAGAFLKVFASYSEVPECTVTSSTMWAWTGNVDNNWSNTGNWGSGTLPGATSDVIIQTGAVRDCRINILGAFCHSILVQSGRNLLLDNNSTSLIIADGLTVYGGVSHTADSASLFLSSGELLIDGGTYNHTGNGTFNATNADIRILNGGTYNFNGQSTVTVKNLYIDNFGTFSDSVADGVFTVQNFNIDANGQFTSNRPGTLYNVSGNFTNDGSMSGTTGGEFRFSGEADFAGNSVTHIMYSTVFTNDTTITTMQDITVLNFLGIKTNCTLSASSGTVFVGQDWLNEGVFNSGTGTVILNGTSAQSIQTGGYAWHNLNVANSSGVVTFADAFTTSVFTCNSAGARIAFNSNDTYEITSSGGFVLNGGAGNEIRLGRNGGSGTDQWLINPSGGSWSVNYVDVSNSVNIADLPILPANSNNSGNNINWFSGDQDFDDLPDYWEYHYYSSLVNNASSDTDSDTLNAFDEYILESNPTVAISKILYVDCNAGYKGEGSLEKPFKYLSEALDKAVGGTLISLADGVYTLSDYGLKTRVIIKGSKGAEKTIIHGATPTGAIGDKGQMLHVFSERFILSDVTLRLFRNDQPIVSYNTDKNTKFIVFQNLIFKDNLIKTKSILAPIGEQDEDMKLYLLNSLFYSNSALAAVDLQGTPAKMYSNTLFKNTFEVAVLVTGKGDTKITNNISWNADAEIKDMGGGALTVSNCNIEGGYPGAIDSYDKEEKFIGPANGYFGLLPGSPGENAGLDTFVTWDMSNLERPPGGVDVGAYEISVTDTDNDGLTNAFEIANGYNPDYPDSDSDGLSDGEEINTYGTNPNKINSDTDYINDGDEPAMGMDPSVFDGDGDIDGVYSTSFEDDTDFPVGPIFNTIWGPGGNPKNSNVIIGLMTIENVGAAAYDGVKVSKAAGQTPESSMVGWVDCGGLDNYWISIAFKLPRAKLPTDINEAINIAGAFMAIDENGYLNIWDPSSEIWLRDSQVTPDEWFNLTVHRDHPGKTVNIWIETRQAFAGIAVSSPHPADKFRISMSSVGEQDAFTDLWSALPFSPF